MKRIALSILICFFFFDYSIEDDVIKDLRAKSDVYFTKYSRKKLQLFFDQPKYAPGDTARFNILYVSARNLEQTTGNQIVHVAWFDQAGKKVLAQFAKVTNGWASCEMRVPPEILPGNYLVVAYTDWMKNLPTELFFKQNFLIVGNRSISPAYVKDSIDFFPEGGHLIAEVSNQLAFRYSGKETRATLKIKENGVVIGVSQVKRDSVSVFNFTPREKNQYSAELELSSVSKSVKFPPIEAHGIGLHVEPESQTLKIGFQFALDEGQKKEKFYAAVYHKDELIYHSPLESIVDSKMEIKLPANLFTGIAQLIVFDSHYKLYASRTVYIPTALTENIKLDNLQPVYSNREPVKITVSSADAGIHTKSKLLSARIINDDLLKDATDDGMDYLSFKSDISNTFHLKNKGATAVSINNYLITQTCPWFNWDKIINNSSAPILKPQQYIALSGSANYSKTGKPLPDSTLLMFFLEKNLQGFETYTAKKGRFSFPLFFDITKSDHFFYTASFKGKDIDDITVKLDDPDSSYTFSARPWQMSSDSIDRYSIYTSQRLSINTSYTFFSKSRIETDSINDAIDPIEKKLGGADKIVKLSDYLLLPTMVEVAREILPAVEYRFVGNRHVVRVYTTRSEKPNNFTGPLYVIDGKLTKDAAYFVALNPADVVQIKLITDARKLLALGTLGANGIIIIKTRKADKNLNERHSLYFPGLLPAPKQRTALALTPYKPYFESCLYWVSNITNTTTDVTPNVEFITPDDVGRFVIQIYGMSGDGNTFTYQQRFSVKYAGN